MNAVTEIKNQFADAHKLISPKELEPEMLIWVGAGYFKVEHVAPASNGTRYGSRSTKVHYSIVDSDCASHSDSVFMMTLANSESVLVKVGN